MIAALQRVLTAGRSKRRAEVNVGMDLRGVETAPLRRAYKEWRKAREAGLSPWMVYRQAVKVCTLIDGRYHSPEQYKRAWIELDELYEERLRDEPHPGEV